MRIVIDIPEDVKAVIDRNGTNEVVAETIWQAVKNGIPLDKIRAEIQENINYNKKMNYQGIVTGLLLALDIIDKHKAESEDTE